MEQNSLRQRTFCEFTISRNSWVHVLTVYIVLVQKCNSKQNWITFNEVTNELTFKYLFFFVLHKNLLETLQKYYVSIVIIEYIGAEKKADEMNCQNLQVKQFAQIFPTKLHISHGSRIKMPL